MNKKWYVVYTTPRGEKKASQRLEQRGIQTYLPVRETIRQWSDRKKKVLLPLFTSYLFVNIDLVHDKYSVLETNGVVAFVKYLGSEAVVRDEEIDAIKYMLKNYTEIETSSIQVGGKKTLEPGQRVEIQGGTLKGQSGIIKNLKNNTLVLELENIGFQMIAKIPVEQVRIQ
ncbi:UpxY family transcription antiterminator [Chondrinema litorale]|uniref:UpxY family transcription antiterminator n=1 Tax=Chondrinema litorale TaxID=2994555 RepID=UPI002543AB47|nr:UpxY family transcription antiterminator [Chondrinema litorale]UZR95501.1 UpxY family transcription antiterminator [Chondrinema litorale]